MTVTYPIFDNMTRTLGRTSSTPPVVPTGPFVERTTFVSSTPANSAQFGYGVALSGDGAIMAVGATVEDEAYVYDWDGSAYVQRGGAITGSDTAPGDQFGSDCAFSDDGAVLAVGALNEGADGAAYVYDWNGSAWIERAKVVRVGAGTSSDFGESVSLSSDGVVLAVGAAIAGTVEVFDWNGVAYVLRTTVTGVAVEEFGTGVALSGDGVVLAVGEPKLDEGGTASTGAAYVYDWNGSAYIQRGGAVIVPGVPSNTRVGRACSLSSDGSVMVLGSMGIGGNGAAYVFTRNGASWDLSETLIASDGATNDFFGLGVGLSSDGTVLAVGSPRHDGTNTDQGKAYVFQRT